jgi:hypothetical protein
MEIVSKHMKSVRTGSEKFISVSVQSYLLIIAVL